MDSQKKLSIASLCCVIVAYAATATLLFSGQTLSDSGINIDVAAWGLLVLLMIAFALGVFGRSSKLGVTGAVLALLMICLFLFQLMETGAPQAAPAPVPSANTSRQ